MSELWAAVLKETDGYTFHAERVLGIYSSRGLAEKRCSDHAASSDGEKPEYYETKPVMVDEDW